MLGFIRGVLLGLILIGAGWIVGSLYPAPTVVTAPIARAAPDLAARLGIEEISLDGLAGYMSAEQLERLRHEATVLASAAGEAVRVERDDEALREAMATFEGVSFGGTTTPVSATAPGATAPSATSGASAFETALSLCPRMTVSNAPAAGASGLVRNYAPIVAVNGVSVAVNPTHGACLSSAFGPRGSGRHKGLDFYSGTGGPIFAAADGVIIERKYRDDYGNMLLIDHGGGVYTRYAHLSSFAADALEGARVTAGQQIGLMGNTASYQIPIHLHYELLLGDYNNPRASFGLDPRSPFDFRAP